MITLECDIAEPANRQHSPIRRDIAHVRNLHLAPRFRLPDTLFSYRIGNTETTETTVP